MKSVVTLIEHEGHSKNRLCAKTMASALLTRRSCSQCETSLNDITKTFKLSNKNLHIRRQWNQMSETDFFQIVFACWHNKLSKLNHRGLQAASCIIHLLLHNLVHPAAMQTVLTGRTTSTLKTKILCFHVPGVWEGIREMNNLSSQQGFEGEIMVLGLEA